MRTRTQCEVTEVWLVLRGSLNLTVNQKEYTVTAGQSIRLYEGCVYLMYENTPSMIGRILISDYRSTVLRVLHYPSSSQIDLLRRIFFLAMDLQSQPLNTKDRVMSAMDNLVNAVRVELLSHGNTNGEAGPTINAVIEKIHAHYSDPDFDLADVIAETNYNPNYFINVFREQIGLTPHQFLIQHRIDASKECIRNSGCKISIQTVAERCGFSDASYYSRQFQIHEGMSPSKYMKKISRQQ